jgi:multidrug efflux system membrane fusion protein
VIQSNVAHLRGVTPGVTDGGLTQVDGINPGDEVATSSFDKLQDNTAVAIPSQTPNQAPGQTSNKGSNKPTAAHAKRSSAP